MKKPNLTLWFLRRFSKFRELKERKSKCIDAVNSLTDQLLRLRKKAESDANLIESLNRYIESLEGRDKGRLALISKLETQCRELRERLSGLLPSQ